MAILRTRKMYSNHLPYRLIDMHKQLRMIIRLSDISADRRTHLLWLVSRSVVDTLYWTETVTTSRPNVVDDGDVVWVLIWLVEYSRGVVYVTELISVTESKRVKKNALEGCFASFHRAEGMIWEKGGRGKVEEKQGVGYGRERDGLRNVRRRQYLRVRRPANIHACVSRNITNRMISRASGRYHVILHMYAFKRNVHKVIR